MRLVLVLVLVVLIDPLIFGYSKIEDEHEMTQEQNLRSYSFGNSFIRTFRKLTVP
jgi:hypothetical protein